MIGRNQQQRIWLGQWRDHLPPEAVTQLQDILGVPKTMSKKWEVHARIIVEASTAKDAEEMVQSILDSQTQDDVPRERRFYDSFIDGPAVEPES